MLSQSGFFAGSSISTSTVSMTLPSGSLTSTTTLSPGFASSDGVTVMVPSSPSSALPGPSVSTVVPSSTEPPVFGISTGLSGVVEVLSQSGFFVPGSSGVAGNSPLSLGLVPLSFSSSSETPSPSSSSSLESGVPSPSVSSSNFALASSLEPSGYSTVTGTSNSSTVSLLSFSGSASTVTLPVDSSMSTV